MDKSLLEQDVHEVDFTDLDPIEELRKINPQYMAVYDAAKKGEKMFFLRAYDVQSPMEEMLIQRAIDLCEPIRVSGTEEAKVRQELAQMAAKGIEIDDPAIEAEWQAKLNKARLIDKERAKEIKQAREDKMRGSQPKDVAAGGQGSANASNDANQSGNVEDKLSAIVGLGAKSIEKLNNAGIKTASEFNALSHEQKRTIVGPVVAENFKDK